MITIRGGDMFAEEVDAIVNPVNCVGVMGAGLAVEFKTRWPRYFSDYVVACDGGRLSPGLLHLGHGHWRYADGGPLTIVSFPTKIHWRDKSNIRYIANGLHKLGGWLSGELAITTKARSIAIPALGCGLGGLDWKDVKPLMISMLEAHAPDVDIRIYEPR